MKSQDEIRAEIDRLLDADHVEEAAALVDQLEPVSLEEFERRLAEAPYEDEPPSEEDRRVFDRAWKVILGETPERASRPA